MRSETNGKLTLWFWIIEYIGFRKDIIQIKGASVKELYMYKDFDMYGHIKNIVSHPSAHHFWAVHKKYPFLFSPEQLFLNNIQ